ncbi:hypothetical protein D0837_17745 [Bordetella avium]|nr:hypothetical protein D0432_17175 [Bordetella avium]RIQ43661.1 hypothetical protein D0845_17965 [Bordetella avium]RIQ51059.1 hypothetical protein D0843_11255 [Bordetella avium]RIQ57576.1 hypothetical protein D0842_17570 [Bordetella avium]RIQ58167.1 hypothetical protein D0841_10320 [Bordetella avium]
MPAGKVTPISYANADPFLGAIVSSGLATLSELKTLIDLEEAMDLWEIATTNKVNEIRALEAGKGR